MINKIYFIITHFYAIFLKYHNYHISLFKLFLKFSMQCKIHTGPIWLRFRSRIWSRSTFYYHKLLNDLNVINIKLVFFYKITILVDEKWHFKSKVKDKMIIVWEGSEFRNSRKSNSLFIFFKKKTNYFLFLFFRSTNK